MILDAPFFAAADGFARAETAEFVAAWRGFLFVRGCRAGAESVARFFEILRRLGPEEAFALPKGSFALCVLDKTSGEIFGSVDPFGLMRLFASRQSVSDDLFALCRHLGDNANNLDRDGLAAFLRFGFYTEGRTIDRRVRALSGDEIVHIAPDGEVGFRRKAFADIRTAPPPFDFDAYLRDIRLAIVDARVSLDLTGGFDSRLLVACLKAAGIAETATSGQDGNVDVRIARRVAATLNLPHIAVKHEVADLAERLPELLRLTQGQIGLLTYDHMYQFLSGRQARGITLCIAGVGGELWKDFLWLQDFPFLSGRADFDRLFRTRIEPRPPGTASLAPSFIPVFEKAKQNYLAAMRERFGTLDHTLALDAVYAFQRLPWLTGPSIAAGIRAGLPTLCPFLDRDGVIASMHKPKSERLFSRWHRETIREQAPEVAAIRTTEGLTARGGIPALTDLPFYAGNKALRLAQKIAQRLNLPEIVRVTLDNPQLLKAGMSLAEAPPALERLRAADVLTREADAAQLGRALFDRLLTAGLTLEEISAEPMK